MLAPTPPPADIFPSADLLPALLEASPTGTILYSPVHDTTGAVVDFALAYVNPAAQRLLHLPAAPALTYSQLLPENQVPGGWAQHYQAYRTGEPTTLELLYQVDGWLQRWQVAVRRVGAGLLACFLAAPRLAPELAAPAYTVGLQHLADTLPQIVWLTDALGRTQFFNRQWTAYTGIAYEPSTAAAVAANFVHPDDAAPTMAAFAEAQRGTHAFEVEHRIRSAAGDYRWFLVRAEPYYDPHTKDLTHWVGTSVDIHDRKVAEDALRHLEERQTFLLKLSDRLRPLVDPVDIQYQAACAIGEYLGADRVGYAEDQNDEAHIAVTRNYTRNVPGIEGRYHYDDYGPALLRALREGRTVVRADIANDPTLTAAEKAAHAVLQLGATVNVPLLKGGRLIAVLFMHYQRAHHWREDELVLLAETAERTWAAVVRARAEAALRHSEERLQKALSIETVGVVFLDAMGNVRAANEAFERLSGYARPDLVQGRVRWGDLTPPEFEAVTEAAHQELLTTGQNTPYEKQALRADGSRWWGLYAGKRIGENEFVTFVLDITSSKQAAGQLQTFNEQLQRANVDLDNFVYTASHDLMSPIINIEGLTYALQAQLPAAVQQTYEVEVLLTMMQESVQRFKRTIEHLSDITKLQKEQDQPVAPIALLPVVEDVRLDLASLIRQVGAQVEVDLTAGAQVLFSLKNLRSVVYNLLSNALKYHHPARLPYVRIGCHQEAGYTVLTVQDNGLGLTTKQQGELFKMFRRLHQHVEGSGVGLYMVKRIVENMRGRITVQSEPEVGTTFSVFFHQ